MEIPSLVVKDDRESGVAGVGHRDVRSGKQASPWEQERFPHGNACTFLMRRNMKRVFLRSVEYRRFCRIALHRIAAAADALRAVMAPMGNMASPKGAFLCESGRLRSNALE